MLPLTEHQDELLKRLVRTEGTVHNISIEAGVSAGTVIRFRQACANVDAMSEELQGKVRRLLLAGMPAAQISARLHVPIRSVCDLRRLDRFRKPGEGDMVCNECGSVICPPVNHDILSRGRKKMRGRISQDNTRTLCDIVLDLLQLGDLQLITSPLFYHLTQRAEKVYEKIHGRKKKKEAKRR